MNKKILNKIIFIIISTTFVLLLMTVKSNAAKLSISTSKSTVSPGETFTVTVSVSGGAGSVSASVSNGSGGKTEFLDNNSFSFSCKAGNSGSVTIKASGVVADYTTEKDENKSATKTVTIKQPEATKPNTSGSSSSSGSGSGSSSNSNSSSSSSSSNKPSTATKPVEQPKPIETPKSSDSTLKSLSVIEGAISPEFNKDVREYTLNVPNEIGGANVTAIPTDSKATVTITGNVGLKEGENTVTIIVVAEDGSSSKYLIRVNRARPALSLQSLIVKYTNQEGNLVEVLLNPTFNFQTYEYTLEDLEYWVEKLEIDTIANLEGAIINIQGADNLVEGENIVTITVKAPMQIEESGEQQEEIKTYTIKFNKKEQPAPPTLMGKISNWFNGMFATAGVWYNGNQEQIVLWALAVCVVALLGLSIYIIVDYYKYKDLIAKLKNINEIKPEKIEESNELNQENDKPKGGKHF